MYILHHLWLWLIRCREWGTPELETDAATLELEMDVAALELETDVAVLDLEMETDVS
jgi:hypothetical protein